MIVYFLDRDMQVLGVASTHQPGTHQITNDKMTDELSAASKAFEFDMIYKCKNRKNADICTAPGNYILRERDGVYSRFEIVDSEEDTGRNRINVYAEDAGMDLINKTVEACVPGRAMQITEYLAPWLTGTNIEIGINEISDVRKDVYWTGEQSAAKRIRECVEKFGAEMDYSFEIQGLHIIHIYLNIYAKRGTTTYRPLRMGMEIKSITKTRSAADVVTGIVGNGNTAEGSEDPITLSGYSYDDGDYYVSGESLLSRKASARWCRNGQGHILDRKHYEADSQSELFGAVMADLQSRVDIETTWQAQLNYMPKGLSAGEMVRVMDEKRGIYFTARVISLTDSETRSRTTAELGEVQDAED